MEFKLDNDTTLVLPERSEDVISEGLRLLTKVLDTKKLADAGNFVLGGEFGYGANFENDVFMIHRYCWCGKEECLWCRDGSPKDVKMWGDGSYLEDGSEPREVISAPNFWHKKSGLKIWWYKWIGRSMEMVSLEGNLIEWDKILKSCIDSL